MNKKFLLLVLLLGLGGLIGYQMYKKGQDGTTAAQTQATTVPPFPARDAANKVIPRQQTPEFGKHPIDQMTFAEIKRSFLPLRDEETGQLDLADPFGNRRPGVIMGERRMEQNNRVDTEFVLMGITSSRDDTWLVYYNDNDGVGVNTVLGDTGFSVYEISSDVVILRHNSGYEHKQRLATPRNTDRGQGEKTPRLPGKKR